MASHARRKDRRAITLSEDDGVRYLHFGTEWVQGGMRIARPFSLELEYQKQMMAVALLVQSPRRIVQLGIGAAALTKFCYRHLRQATTVAVDVSQAVIDAARTWFCLPQDDERLTTVTDDAREFLSDPRRCGKSDWLQVDLYDAAARGPVYDDTAFYRQCRQALRKPGVAAFNLFGSSFDQSFTAIAEAFSDRVVVLPEVDDGNRVALAVTGPKFVRSLRQMRHRASAIESAWKLPANRWVEGLWQENGLSDAIRL